MEDRAAIKATFVDLRSVKTRSQTQLVFEIPIEQTDAALEALGGYPQPKGGKWVAIARINEGAAQKEPEKPKRPPATTRAEKARRMCGVMAFQDFMLNRGQRHTWPQKWGAAERYQHTSLWIKQACNVQSKAELDPTDGATFCNAGNLWDALLAEYEQQAGRMAEIHG